MDGDQARAFMGVIWAIAVFGGALALGFALFVARRRTRGGETKTDQRSEEATRRLYDEPGGPPGDQP